MSFSLTTGAIVEKKRLVKMSGANVVHNTAASTDKPVGFSSYYGASGDIIDIEGINEDEPVEITAAGPFAAGAALYAAAEGKVQALPAVSATYSLVMIAVEAATTDGDIVLALPYYNGITTTV